MRRPRHAQTNRLLYRDRRAADVGRLYAACDGATMTLGTMAEESRLTALIRKKYPYQHQPATRKERVVRLSPDEERELFDLARESSARDVRRAIERWNRCEASRVAMPTQQQLSLFSR